MDRFESVSKILNGNLSAQARGRRMIRKTDEEALAEAEQLQKHNEERVGRQRKVVLGLQRAGGDVTEALASLEELLKLQDNHERRLAYLRTWCGK